MKVVLCGHRGVGKTSLLRRLAPHLKNIEIFDLDEVVEVSLGKSISDIFSESGEAGFRQIEATTFLNLASSTAFVMSVGAGFDMSRIPDDVFVIYVQRETDSEGRIFHDRPRLRGALEPLVESQQLFNERETKFLSRADFIYQMLEGMSCAGEKILQLEALIFETLFSFFGSFFENSSKKSCQKTDAARIAISSYIVTLEPGIFARRMRFEIFLHFAKRFNWTVELRDDLLSEEQLSLAKAHLEPHRICFSYRKTPKSEPKAKELQNFAFVDWALELGKVPDELRQLKSLIISCHEPDFKANLEKLAQEKKSAPGFNKLVIQKSSPVINNFIELQQFQEFFDSNCDEVEKQLSILPRSTTGRWKWLRLLRTKHQQLNYLRFWQGSAVDQPSLIESLIFQIQTSNFAAVLGDPIKFSFSPVFHHEFFAKRETCMLPVQIERTEWNVAFSILRQWGLQFAAVTSPHKKALFESVQSSDLLAAKLSAANTFFKNEIANTDEFGFEELLKQIDSHQLQSKKWVIWGGGGTKALLEVALPMARHISVRDFANHEQEWDHGEAPDILVWAAPRAAVMTFPPVEWAPIIVIDLNYNSISPGLEYAQKVKAKYISGLSMFLAQAEKQQEIWSR